MMNQVQYHEAIVNQNAVGASGGFSSKYIVLQHNMAPCRYLAERVKSVFTNFTGEPKTPPKRIHVPCMVSYIIVEIQGG